MLCCNHTVNSVSRSVSVPTGSRRLLQSRKYALSNDPDNKGCYVYRAQTGDTIEQMAKDLGVSADDLKERNAKNIADFSRLNGRFIQICSVGSELRCCSILWRLCGA